MTLLESLKQYTTVVADTGDINAIAQYRPQDATTNTSLLYQAARISTYRLLADAVGRGQDGFDIADFDRSSAFDGLRISWRRSGRERFGQ